MTDGKWVPVQMAPGYKFEKAGDSLTGVLVDKIPKDEESSSKYIIETQDGMVTVYGKMVLDNRMSRIEIGKRIKIVYKGEFPSKKTKHTYKDFDVQIWQEEGPSFT